MMLPMLIASGGASGASLPASISVSDNELSPTDASASFSMSNAGTYSSVGTPGGPSGTWRNWGASADYDVRFDVSAGTLTTGTANTWENMASSRSWSKVVTGTGSSVVSGTLRVRSAITLVELDSCPLDLTATVDI